MTEYETTLVAAFLMGLGSSAHCFGMCGGIACALGFQQHTHPKTAVLLYNLGRISAYATVAWLLGSLIETATAKIPLLMPWLRTLAAVLLFAMAANTLQWWRGILALEALGQSLWKPVQSASMRFMPSSDTLKPLITGFVWGWLPCALVYSTLVWAVTQSAGLHAAWIMLAFGTGTLPAMLVSGMTAQRMRSILQSANWRYGMALLLTLCGLWTLQSAWLHAHQEHNSVNHHGIHNHPAH